MLHYSFHARHLHQCAVRVLQLCLQLRCGLGQVGGGTGEEVERDTVRVEVAEENRLPVQPKRIGYVRPQIILEPVLLLTW